MLTIRKIFGDKSYFMEQQTCKRQGSRHTTGGQADLESRIRDSPDWKTLPGLESAEDKRGRVKGTFTSLIYPI